MYLYEEEDKMFDLHSFLIRFGHKKEKHTGAVEIFPCPDCGKNFSRKSNLKVRENSINHDENPSYFIPLQHYDVFRPTEIPYILERNFPVHSVSGFLQIGAQ